MLVRGHLVRAPAPKVEVNGNHFVLEHAAQLPGFPAVPFFGVDALHEVRLDGHPLAISIIPSHPRP
jgi:hypothetical protein